jgi:hypothetical protein
MSRPANTKEIAMNAAKNNPVQFLRLALSTLSIAVLLGAAAVAGEAATVKGDSSKLESSAASTRYTFVRHTFDVSRKHGHVYFGNYWYARPLVEQSTYVRLIEVFDGRNFKSNSEFSAWAKKLRGTRTYTYDTVQRHDGNQVTNLGPLVLLPNDQRTSINPYWANWRSQQDALKRDQVAKAKRESLRQARLEAELASTKSLLNSTANSAQSLSLLSGKTSLWEVQLFPRNSHVQWVPNQGTHFSFNSGSTYRPWTFYAPQQLVVTSYGRDSLSARNAAIQAHPNYQAGFVRKLAGY